MKRETLELFYKSTVQCNIRERIDCATRNDAPALLTLSSPPKTKQYSSNFANIQTSHDLIWFKPQ